MSTVRVAVMGLGVMGRQHVRVLREIHDAELVAVCDASEASRSWAESTLGVPAVAGWGEILDMEVDAVVNALPTGLHFEATRPFLERQIPVLVEKPIAGTLDEAQQLVELAEATNTFLMVGHVERFNPAVTALREQIRVGRLGKIISIMARRVGVARPVLPHVNVALDLAIHDLDVVSHLLDTPGQLLLASGSAIESNILEDHVDLVLRYGDTTAMIQANWITPVKVRRLSVTGTKATAELDYIEQTVVVYDAVPEIIKGLPWDFFAVSTESSPVPVKVERAEPLSAELRHFLEGVQDATTAVSNAGAATRALSLAVQATKIMRGTVHAGG